MKVTYRTANDRLTFEVDCQTGKAAFEVIAAIQELFEEPACGACKSTNIRGDVREVKTNKFFLLLCNACGARLDIGQNKDGKGLFVKRTDKAGKPRPNNGWYHWQPTNTNDNAPSDSDYQHDPYPEPSFP